MIQPWEEENFSKKTSSITKESCTNSTNNFKGDFLKEKENLKSKEKKTRRKNSNPK